MNANQLKDLLGIKLSTSKPDIQYEIKAKNDGPSKERHASCFDLDEWEVEHGARLSRNQVTLSEQIQTDWMMFADLFAACFRQYPEPEYAHIDDKFQEFIDTLLESPDFKVLHESTRANVMASDMTAVRFAREYAKIRDEQRIKREQEVKEGTSNNTNSDKDVGKIACLRAVSNALTQAQTEIDQLEDAQRAFGLEETQGSETDTSAMLNIFNKVKNNPTLRRICELAGRYRRMAQAKQRQKTSHGFDDMVGVEMGGDVGRLLPIELAKLGDEDLELDTMRRLVEHQTMCREYRGIEKEAKGPIVVCVDESGSMQGEPHDNAKALALAMYWIAKHQNRDCWLVGFHAGTAMTSCYMEPRKDNGSNLLQWLEHFYNGGTTLDVPLVQVPAMWHTQSLTSKADIIIITDAQVQAPDQMQQDYINWKHRNKVRTISLIIGANGAGGLAHVSDEVHFVPTLTVEAEAVSNCLSI